MRVALTRAVSPAIAHCELTHLARESIDVARAIAQHTAYEQTLQDLGCQVLRVPPAPDLPDAVFIEDTAVVLDEVAIATRPGAASRRAEVDAVAEAIRAWRQVVRIEAPGTLDGGDVLRAGRTLFVGMSDRTNADGIEQLRPHVAPFGYQVVPVSLTGCLHLKTGVTAIAPDTLLINRRWIDATAFGDFTLVDIDPDEPFAANALRIGDVVLLDAAHERTAARVAALGLHVQLVDNSELARAEGGLTCCCVLVES